MKTITFTCETITPMFLSGADGQTPELRPPSIKGALRFWWRAVSGHLGLEELKKQESLIFGGTDGESGGRSNMIVRAKPLAMPTEVAFLVPHKAPNMKQNAFKPKSRFEVTLALESNPYFSFEQMKALFELVCVLGGLGKRVRRGMGSVRVMYPESKSYPEITLEYICSRLQAFSPYFKIQYGAVYNTYAGRMEKYGWISSIEIAMAEKDNITLKISETTHKYHQPGSGSVPQVYEASIGHAFRGRFASPVYVSLLAEKQAIITTLNTVPNRDADKISLSLQENFKSDILRKK